MNITERQILIPTLTTVNTAGSTVILLNLHAEKNTGKKIFTDIFQLLHNSFYQIS